MGSTNKTPLFFTPKPLFGLDIGNGSMKVMQLEAMAPVTAKSRAKSAKVIGYGTASFSTDALDNGVVSQPLVIAKAAKELFQSKLIGDITTRRVALTIPSYRTFTRSVQLPKLNSKDLQQAVSLELEQYTPVPIDELYLDYSKISDSATTLEVLAIAVPKKIVDSYLELAMILGLEPILIETTLNSACRLFALDSHNEGPTVIIDFGSRSADISIYDKTLLATSTVQGGGEVFTNLIKAKLHVTDAEAGLIKTKYGLGKSRKQKEIREALSPLLEQIVKEIRRLIRYFNERYGNEKTITQIVALGGGANMPGLSDYLTENLRIAVRTSEPWQYFDYSGLQPPSSADKPMYATAAGLSLAEPREVFRK